METESTKTLTEIDASLSSERARSSEPLGSAVQSQENGDRFSAGVDGGLSGDVHLRVDGGEIFKNQVVQTEISVQKSFACTNGDGGSLEDSKATGILPSSEHERRGKTEHGGRSQAIEGLADGDSTLLIGDGSDKKMELDQNGNSLVVEVQASLDSVSSSGKNNGYEEDKGSAGENGGNTGEGFKKIPDSKGTRKHEVNQNGQENDDDGEEDEGEDEEEDEGEDEEEDVGDQEHEYLVGDFVWGKIRSHPWWPGQIYDPSDASEYARKYNPGTRLLVAYFGDGSFSWCSPSQLKPFAESFEEISKQSQSISFVNAVQKGLDEIGRLVELKMTCSCLEENQIALARPPSINAGIKQGVLVPGFDLSRFLIPLRQPAELLVTLRYLAEVVSITSLLELTLLRSCLSAFYRAKGGHKLAIYHEPLCIEGLEDKNRNGVTYVSDFSVPVEVPFEGPSEEDDWLSSPVHSGLGQTKKSLLQRCPEMSDGKLYHTRKKKSVAELMKDDMVVEQPNNKKGSVVKDVTTPVSTSGKRKRKTDDEALSGSKIGRGKRTGTLGSAENKASSAKNGGGEGEKETKRMEGVSSVRNGDSTVKGKIEKGSASRERKKSKYLSPPFTNLKWGPTNVSSGRDNEAKSVKIAKVERIGERMSRAAGQLIGSPPPVVNRSDETFKEKLSNDTPAISSPHQPRNQKKMIDSVEINASTKEVVSQVRSAALNPLHLREKIAVDMFREFVSAFRSAIYLNGSNYKMYNRDRPGRKRKSLSPRPGLLGKDLNQTDHEARESKPLRTRIEKNEQAKSGMKNLKQAGDGSSEAKTIDKERAGDGSTPVILIVTFPPGFSLPSQNDLITVFSKYGPLNEKETGVLYNSNCSRVVFVNSCDGEEAFKTCIKKSPFGSDKVKYRLRYSSAASRASEGNRKANSPAAKEGDETLPVNPVGTQASSAFDEASKLLLMIKQKLEMMTSMVEESDGDIMLPEMKTKLKDQMKGLLEEVNTVMTKSSSSYRE